MCTRISLKRKREIEGKIDKCMQKKIVALIDNVFLLFSNKKQKNAKVLTNNSKHKTLIITLTFMSHQNTFLTQLESLL
jgi:hypothetical protein